MGGGHGALGVPQHRPGPGRAGRGRRRSAGHRAAEPGPAGRGDRPAGAAGGPGVRARAGRADGGGHRRRRRAAAAGLHPARALPAGRTRRADHHGRLRGRRRRRRRAAAPRRPADRGAGPARPRARWSCPRCCGWPRSPARSSRPAAGCDATCFSADEQVVVDAFVDAACSPATRARTEPAVDEAAVEVAHEALLRQWPPLREAIEADRACCGCARSWSGWPPTGSTADRDDAYLLRGGRLATIDQWASQHTRASSGSLEREFLEASRGLGGPGAGGHPPVQPTPARWPAAWRCCWLLALVAGGWPGNQRISAGSGADPPGAVPTARCEADRLVDTRPDLAILAGLQSLSLARDQSPATARPG